MALPDPTNASRRERMAELAKLVGDADLAISRPVHRKLDDDRLDVGRRAVLQDWFAPRQLLQRQFAAGVVKLLEAIETVARVAHHFAGLADIAELPAHDAWRLLPRAWGSPPFCSDAARRAAIPETRG